MGLNGVVADWGSCTESFGCSYLVGHLYLFIRVGVPTPLALLPILLLSVVVISKALQYLESNTLEDQFWKVLKKLTLEVLFQVYPAQRAFVHHCKATHSPIWIFVKFSKQPWYFYKLNVTPSLLISWRQFLV